LLQRLADARDVDALQQTVEWLRDSYDTEHIVYHCVRNSGEQWGALTYDPEWVDIYTENNYQTVDPVVQACFGGFVPVDWKALDWSSKPARKFLNEAIEHGVGNQGVSLPVRGPSGQFSLFTVNGQTSDEQWARFTNETMDQLILAAHYVHERALTLDGTAVQPLAKSLSPREVDALSLLASGRSRSQAAEKLKISEHTLRVYIESARFKLNASNTTHAVAAALNRGLICF